MATGRRGTLRVQHPAGTEQRDQLSVKERAPAPSVIAAGEGSAPDGRM